MRDLPMPDILPARINPAIRTYAPLLQADAGFTDPNEAAEMKRKRTFRKYQYRGIELDKLLDLSNQQFIEVRNPLQALSEP
jgi:hypothetical protein